MVNMNKENTTLVNLVKENEQWVVVYAIEEEVYDREFSTIEQAADFMTDRLKVYNEHIDHALCEMIAYDHIRAVFKSGRYSHSEKT